MLRRFASFMAVLLVATIVAGCGSGATKVEGVVTLDGTPIDKATVTFVPQDGKGQPAVGISDPSGNFSLLTNGKPGAQPGAYKVVVTKTEVIEGLAPGDPKYMEMMKKGVAKSGPMAGGPAGPKTQLPAVYSKAESTPLTQKVPPENSPLKLELKSKP